jgi:hypothetical protein
VGIVESPPLPVTHDLELILDPSAPLQLHREEPHVGAWNPRQFKIIWPDIDAMAQIDRVSLGKHGKRRDVALDDRKSVRFEECRGGRLPLPGIGWFGARGA